jgi:PEP-CTERM motif
MKTVIFCLSALLGLSHVAQSASISAVMGGGLTGGAPGQAYTQYIPASGTGTVGPVFGTVNTNPVPNDSNVYTGWMTGNYLFNGVDKGYVSTTVRRNGTNFFTTTQSWFDQSFPTSLEPMVQLKGFWEFTVQGNYSYTIAGQAPQITGAVRKYEFVKVGGSTLSEDLVGTGATTLTGTVSSGTYRLIFDHRNFSPGVSGPTQPTNNVIGGTNLNIAFTFQSEDNNPVPEPTSLAVFGLLGLGGAIAKWRRKS